MELNKVIHGDTLKETKELPDASVNCVVTSPPYWQLRNYGYPEQWGLEPTYQEYLEHLWSLMDEIWRVLKDDGTVWINLGDTYHNATKWTNKSECPQTISKGNNRDLTTGRKENQNIPEKCLMLIPHRFAIGCIDRGWIVRNDVVWAKRNGMPESVTDRFSKKHEYFFLMVKQQKYYFDLDGIRKPLAESSIKRLSQNLDMQNGSDRVPNKSNGNMKAVAKTKIKKEDAESFGSPRARNHRDNTEVSEGHYAGANPGDVSDFWDIKNSYPNRKYHFRENYFENIDSEDKAYWLGFVWADGYLGKDALEIELHIKDRDHLVEFQEDLCDNHKIYERVRPTTHACRLILGSQKLVKDLIKLGYKEKLIPNNLSVDLERHFIRGLFDGDGSVGFYKGRDGVRHWLEFLGKRELMEWLEKRLSSLGMYKQIPKETRNIFRLSYADSNADIFYNYIYPGYTRCLERKKCRFPQELNYEFDFFDIPTKPSSAKHYASYNTKLIDKPIIAGCPKRVCKCCGEPVY